MTISIIPIAEVTNFKGETFVRRINLNAQPHKYFLELFNTDKAAKFIPFEYDNLSANLKDCIQPFIYSTLLNWGNEQQPNFLVKEIQNSAFRSIGAATNSSISSLKLAYAAFRQESVTEVFPANAIFELLENNTQLKSIQAGLNKKLKDCEEREEENIRAIRTWKRRTFFAFVMASILFVIIFWF